METKTGHARLTWAMQGDIIEGLQGVEIDGVELMNRSFPARFIFQGPEGWDYRSFRHVETVAEGENVILRTEAIGSVQDASWYRDQYDHDILRLGTPQKAPPLQVDFIVTPAAAVYDGLEFQGFTLAWRFRCSGAKLGRLRWQQHWEVGGHAVGNTVYWQSQIASPVATFTRETAWDNFCWKTLLRDKTDENISMQVNCRLAYHQLFDMLCAEPGILLGYFPKAQSVQTACRKNAGEDHYHVFESLEFPLAEEQTLSGKTVLFAAPARQTDAVRKNLWFAVNGVLENSYREQTGIVRSRLLPTMLDWMQGTSAENNRLYFDTHVAGERVPAERHLEWLGQNAMPKARQQGYRRFWTRPFCASDTSELMFWSKSMGGRSVMDGDLAVGSCCCVWEYKPSALFGGGAMARRFYELGHANGLDIGIWMGNHLSTKAPVLRDHPDWVLKDRNFANPAGGYDDQIMAVINWNSGARQWILDDLIAWKRNYGLDFIFFDSLGNLGLKTRNYAAPDLADNFPGIARFVAEVTAAGIEVLCEGRSFLGVPHFGISNDGNMESESDPLRGQNSLGWFRGHEDMFYGMEAFTEHNPRVPLARLSDTHFRIIAGGGMVEIGGGPAELDDQRRIFNHVGEFMQHRTLLENGQGVLWTAVNGNQVAFAFQAGPLALSGPGVVHHVTPAGLVSRGIARAIDATVNSVFLITPPGAEPVEPTVRPK